MKASVALQRAVSSTSLGVGAVYGPTSSARRFKLYDFMLGSDATPADVAITWEIIRQTALGSLAGTAETVLQLDPADINPVTLASQTLTVNGTIAGVLAQIPLNQRATFRWVAAPGSELVSPATASNGFEFQTPELNGGTPSVWVTAFIDEQ